MPLPSRSFPLRPLLQKDAYSTPWTWRHRVRAACWAVVRATIFQNLPKPLNAARLLLLRVFGTIITGTPYVDASAVIKFPWQLTLEHRACLGPRAEVYNLGRVTLRARCTVAQHAYLCGGTHDLSDAALPLVVGDIEIGEDVFVGAKAFVLPGIKVGDRAVIGAAAVVTRDVPADAIVAGNPARVIGTRIFTPQAFTPQTFTPRKDA